MRYEVIEQRHLDECAKAFVTAFEHEQWSVERAYEHLHDLVNNSKAIGFSAFDYNRFVGAAFCREIVGSKYNRLMIEDFFIVPGEQRKGYGIALLDVVRRHVCNNDLGAITLMTERDNPSIAFYEKCGFKRVESMMFLSDEFAE
ncbi:MAG: GNAT family N-acetyltransferase [Clostridiales bacterium]|nr:GNAT family N-acetyltransferase [Clostridiales bacterium]